jgi:hypothetical protein
LRLQPSCNDSLQLGRKAPRGYDLTDQRKGEGAVWKHPNTPLQALVAPHQNVEFVARVDPVSNACRGGLAALLCARHTAHTAIGDCEQQCE